MTQSTQPANVHQLRIGDFMLTTLLDAQMEASFALPQNIDEAEVRRLHQQSRRPTPPRITLNVYLLDTGDRKILIDTGLGGLAGDAGPYLLENLATIGVAPADIDTVLITHVHPDHVGGLIDADDNAVFPQATVLVPAGELDYWGGEIPDDVSDAQKGQFQAAHRVIAAVGSQMQHLEGTEVLPGITRVPLPGHTPDHSGYRIESGHERILLWTDVVHMPQIQFPCPDAGVAFDTDIAQARETRHAIMAELAESGEMVGGHHLDFPGIGYVEADGDGYRFLPHVWQPTV
ncbi:MBL fold metallo-hydrolase [Salinisphaera hydrothermalis]|uniref:MBL fold metallo-hydrolase n=1 Tax=Salinisphaera hydrothermalis TaxID=563188 RepID=UPI003340AE51